MSPYILLAFLIFNISLLFQLQKAGAPKGRDPNSMTKPGCEKQCGHDEVIPYPFGVKKGCYLDELFKLQCGEDGIHNIDVLNHTFRFKNFPVLALDCNRSSEEKYYSLAFDDDRFSISHTRNMFVVMGCDIYGYLTDPDRQEFMGGCATLCDNTNLTSLNSSSCSGLRCCQISLQKDLTQFFYRVATMNTDSRSWKTQCAYVTIVDKNLFHLNNMRYSGCNDTFQSFDVPIVMEWTVGDTNCNIARKKADYACGQNADCTDHRGMWYRCKCKKGYYGNPYLRDGCQDIDECENPDDINCPAHKQCVNTEGGYYCVANHTHILAVPIALGTSLAVGLLILVVIGLWVRRKLNKIKDRKIKQKNFKRNGGLLLQQHISSSGGRVFVADPTANPTAGVSPVATSGPNKRARRKPIRLEDYI